MNKKLFNAFFILLVLFGFVACTQNVDSIIENESLVFSFRTAAGLEGAELTVSVTEAGKNPIVKKENITKDANTITFEFGSFSVGSNVTIVATIIKDNVEFYNGSKNISIKTGENNVLLELKKSSVKLTLSPKDLNLSLDELDGCTFNVKVNGVNKEPVSINSGMTEVSVDIGYQKIGETLNIVGSIKKGLVDSSEIVLYSIEQNVTVQETDTVISLDLSRENVKLSVKAPLVKDSELNGATCKMTVGTVNKEYTIKEGDTQILIDFGYYKTSDVIPQISAIITNKDGIVIYESDIKNDYVISPNKEAEEIILNFIKKLPIEVTVSSTVPLIKGLDMPSYFVVTASGVKKSRNEVGFVGEPYGVLKSNPFNVMVGEKLIASVISSEKGPQGEDIILFEEQYTVKENDSIIDLKIPQVRTLLTISPKLGHSNNNYRCSEFEVTIGDKSYSANFGEHPVPPEPDTMPSPLPDVGEVVVNLGGVEINKPLMISALIKDQNDIFYSYEGEYTPTGNENNGRYELSNMVRNDGYFMWQNGGSSNNSYTINYDLQMMNGCSQDLPKVDTIRDFSFRDNGDVWILENGMSLILKEHGRYGTEYQLSFREATNGNEGQVASNIAQVYSLASYKEGVIVNSEYNSSNRLSFLTLKPSVDLDPNQSKLFVNDYNLDNSITGDFVTAMAIGGDTIYIATLFEKKEISPKTNFKIFKGIINQQNWTISSVTEILDGNSYLSNGKAIFDGFDFVVTDMQVVDGSLYVLVCDDTEGPISPNGWANKHSRGALLKIPASGSGSSSVIGLHENRLNTGEIVNDGSAEDANRIYMLDKTQTDLLNTSFVGPRKIIAVKPKKIVIADAGAVKRTADPSQEEKDLRKRIVTVNLEGTVGIENIQDVSPDLFEGSFASGYSYSSGL